MRSFPSKPTSLVSVGRIAAGGRGPSVAPFMRRSSGALVGLVNAPRKPPQARRVDDLAPGERVPVRSRLVFRRGSLSEK